MGESGGNQYTVILQHPSDLQKGFFRLGYNMQGIGHDHNIEGLIGIRQMKHILHRKIQLRPTVLPFGLRNHFRGSIRGLDMLRLSHNMLGNHSGAGGQLQHRFVFYHRSDQRI